MSILIILFGIGLPCSGISEPAEFYRKSHALVVGIDRYQKFPPLVNAVNDAHYFARFLEKQGFQVTLLLNSSATRYGVLREIDRLRKNVRKDDRVVVYFSGHGVIRRSFANMERTYIVPHDGEQDSPSNYIGLAELEDYSRTLGSSDHQLFILNSCIRPARRSSRFEGLPIADVKRTKPKDQRFLSFERALKQRGRLVLTAGLEYSNRFGRYSQFTTDVVQGIERGHADTNGDGYVTISELHGFLNDRVKHLLRAGIRSVPGGAGARNLSSHAGGDMAFRSFRMPAFPPRPPRWTSRYVLPTSLVVEQAPGTLGSTYDRLIQALDRAGIEQRSVYAFQHDGFAIVSKLENIDEEGRPRPGKLRWVEQSVLTSENTWSLDAILFALFRANPGRYRVIVLAVSPRPVIAGKGDPQKEEMEEMLRMGAGDLPNELRTLIPKAPVKCHALVYEFYRPSEDMRPELLAQSHLSAQRHLVGGGLWTEEEIAP